MLVDSLLDPKSKLKSYEEQGRYYGLVELYCFDLFSGNTYEGHTLKIALLKLKSRFPIEQLIVVADAAMLSKENITLLKGSGYQYII